jgi:hypothetical protein
MIRSWITLSLSCVIIALPTPSSWGLERLSLCALTILAHLISQSNALSLAPKFLGSRTPAALCSHTWAIFTSSNALTLALISHHPSHPQDKPPSLHIRYPGSIRCAPCVLLSASLCFSGSSADHSRLVLQLGALSFSLCSLTPTVALCTNT